MWDYKNDDKIREAMTSNNLLRLRSMVKGILMDDPADSEGLAVDLLTYICKTVSDVMEVHDKEWAEIITDQSQWTKEYRNTMSGALIKNFSQERFTHVIEVGKYLFPKKHPGANKKTMQEDNKAEKKKAIFLGAGLGLVVGLTLLRASPPVGAIITVASLACGAYALMKKGKKA